MKVGGDVAEYLKRRVKVLVAIITASMYFFQPSFGQSDGWEKLPGFKLLRSEEDYSILKHDSVQNGFVKRLKYIPLRKENYLTLGGESRSEFQILRNEDWQAQNHDEALFQRLMVHADLQLGAPIRIFTQLKSGLVVGRNGMASPLNEERLDLHQFFVGLNIGPSTLEIGRRELSYGSQRLLSVREGTNIRQSFNGLRWIFRQANAQLDVLLYAYNPQQIGWFDEGIDTDRLLWGMYWTGLKGGSEAANLDIYYLGVRNKEGAFEEGRLEEWRHSIGARYWATIKRFRTNTELVVQAGTFGEGDIFAWTLSTENYYRLTEWWKVTLGIKAEIVSGDERQGDGDLQTFNPLYPRGGYFGLLALVGPANLMDIHPSLHLSIDKKWQLNLDWDFFWRHQLADGVYFPSGRINVAGNASQERFIGHQPGLQLAYAVNRFFELETSYFLFFPGHFLKEVSGNEIFTQFGFSMSLKF
ncbi:MAG: alginate export family protein [Bacteroidota bacterium]